MTAFVSLLYHIPLSRRLDVYYILGIASDTLPSFLSSPSRSTPVNSLIKCAALPRVLHRSMTAPLAAARPAAARHPLHHTPPACGALVVLYSHGVLSGIVPNSVLYYMINIPFDIHYSIPYTMLYLFFSLLFVMIVSDIEDPLPHGALLGPAPATCTTPTCCTFHDVNFNVNISRYSRDLVVGARKN